MKTSIKATLLAAAVASMSPAALAAGLGKINVMSGLGQPLRAEIQVDASAQELKTLAARIASAETFRQANIPYPAVATSVRIALDSRGSRTVLKISSEKPVDDPIVNLLIELNWASGNLAREYVFLLDPVDLEIARPKAVHKEVPVAPRAEPRPETPASAPQAQTDSSAPATGQTAASSYTTQRGDTLARIARANRPEGVTLDQALVALYRENADAFSSRNINRLRSGAILRIPSAAEMQAIDAGEARREVVAHSTDFQAYRRKLAESVAGRDAAPGAETSSGQESSGRVVPRLEEPQQAQASGDKVQISRGAAGRAGGKASQEATNRIRTLEEDLVAREKALDEANSRVTELERNISDLQKLLEIKSRSMGQDPQRAQDTPPRQPDQPQPPVVSPPSETSPASDAPAEAAGSSPAGASVSPAVPVEPPPPVEAPKPEVPPPPPPPKPAPVAPQKTASGFLQYLTPPTLAGLGGVLALLLGYGGYRVWKRRKDAAATDDGSSMLMSEFPPESSGVFAAAGGQSIDTSGNASSLIHTDFSQSGLSAIDADEGVDPVAEADVYMAYGRDAQAEEILLDALKADPSRTAIHLKLLEIYAQRKNGKQFETIAGELYSRTGGVGPDWEKAAQMGSRLDPGNPLYEGGKTQGPTDADVSRSESPHLPAGGGGTVAAAMAAAAMRHDGGSGGEKNPAGTPADLDFSGSVPVIEPSASQLKDTWAMPGALSGDLGQSDNIAPPAEPATVDVPAIDTLDLDFDLDLDAGAPPETPASTARHNAAVETDPLGNGATLDFDLDLSNGPATEPPAMQASPVPRPAGPITAELRSSDLVFDLGDSSAPAEQAKASPPEIAPKASSPQPEQDRQAAFPGNDKSGVATVLGNDMGLATVAQHGLTFDLPELAASKPLDADDFSFDMSETAIDPDMPFPRSDDMVVDLERSNLDGGLLDFGSDQDDIVPQSPSSALPVADMPAGMGGEMGDDHEDDVDTRLELARAYDEMGDREGARELLEEVMREGSPKQQSDARAMLDRLG